MLRLQYTSRTTRILISATMIILYGLIFFQPGIEVDGVFLTRQRQESPGTVIYQKGNQQVTVTTQKEGVTEVVISQIENLQGQYHITYNQHNMIGKLGYQVAFDDGKGVRLEGVYDTNTHVLVTQGQDLIRASNVLIPISLVIGEASAIRGEWYLLALGIFCVVEIVIAHYYPKLFRYKKEEVKGALVIVAVITLLLAVVL